ncbi:transposase, MuDR, MULE transposase domain protein, partial [Tanacetum coccineum]
MTMPSNHFLKLLGFNNHDLPLVEAATSHIMSHTVQVYMGNSQSFENVAIQGNVVCFWSGGLMSYVDLVKVFRHVYEELEYGVLLLNDVNYSNLVRYVQKKFKCLEKRDVTMVYRPKDIAHDVNMEWNIYVSYKNAWKGKHIALASSQGCPIESFAQFPFYYYNLKKENEGTVTDIETDDRGRFKMCFIGFGGAIKSFLCYMRPLIIIDGTHLKGTYLGTNLVVVGMDGNNQIIHIATSVSQGETGESWTWFLRKLKDCIGKVSNLTIISYRHYEITLACNTVFPNSFHGYCCRHLMMNCGMQSDKFKELYWKTCKAYTPEDFEKLMSDIHALRPDAHPKLVDAGIEKWSRAKCPAKRYNYMTSNSVESINALTKY